jgi:hypothetical protein
MSARRKLLAVVRAVAGEGAVQRELATCRLAGAAIDALPSDLTEAGVRLRAAAQQRLPEPLDAFYQLRLDDHVDDADHPLGLYRADVLYFDLWNREQFEAHR